MILMRYKRIKVILVILSMLLLQLIAVGCGAQEKYVENVTIIKTYDDLGKAINGAKNGDTIFVDDIDFTPISSDVYVTENIKEINKSITIKSGKINKSATFINGMFLISGSKIFDKKVMVSFENIIFDGKIDTENLTAENTPEGGFYANAVSFSGNVDCSFTNCTFQNYYGVDGSVIEVRYGDYTNDEFKRNLYADLSNCRLNLTFDKCSVINNRAFYTGGAFLLEGNDNVTLNMTDCIMSENKSGAYYGMGGGAIYGAGINFNLKGSAIKNNQCNFCYPKIENWYTIDSLTDTARGGGIRLMGSSLKMENCVISDNVGTFGGGIALTNTDADFDGCVFVANKAVRCSALKNDDTIRMPCALGQGGALYIDGDDHNTASFINSYIYNNSADIAYGGIYQYYNGQSDDPLVKCYLELKCCSYLNNACDMEYDYQNISNVLWIDMPGDIWTDPHIKASGCLIVDDSFAAAFSKNEKPTEGNGYNYFASNLQASADGVDITYLENEVIPQVRLSQNAMWQIPQTEIDKMVGNRYNGKMKHGVVGSNYSKDFYSEDNESDNDPMWMFIIISISGVLVVGGVVAFIILRNRRLFQASVASISIDNTDEGNLHFELSAEQNQSYEFVVLRHTEEQIEKIMESLSEVQLLTNREREIFREMLLGKKQIEIAKHLYISTSTVKDFYQKIYLKMGVANKKELFKKVFKQTNN